jgi:hypothetical protein
MQTIWRDYINAIYNILQLFYAIDLFIRIRDNTIYTMEIK